MIWHMSNPIISACWLYVDAGKTTLSERFYIVQGNYKKKAWKVDNQDTFLDTVDMERTKE